MFGISMIAAPVLSLAAEKIDIGKREYNANCAVCHGATGKGDGSYGELLKTKMPDLTLLSRNNNGVFPVARVYDVIDGRTTVKAHGPREMPVWGTDYSIKAADYYRDVDYDPDAFVRARILALIDYLNRLQAK
ncbi:MAG: c-type cytochrome [Betaproteobacteria bacterium]|nr:c-type cytochrome [Betaproteobacteria bacterium]